MRRVLSCICIIIMLSVITCGCNISVNLLPFVTDEREVVTSDVSTLSVAPVFDYEYTPMSPRLVTDKAGYEPTGKKVVFLESEDALPAFDIIDMQSGETVYSGSMSKLDISKDHSLHLFVGDFSEFTREGSYRILQNEVGYSHEFVIESGLYKNMYKDIYTKLVSTDYVKTGDLIYVVANLLLTNEMYENAYSELSFIDKSVETLLACRNEETGAVSELLNGGGGESLSGCAELSGLLAKYYTVHRDEEENELAVRALEAALKSYAYMDANRDKVCRDSYYFASAEMYRATGQLLYRNAIALYDQAEDGLFTESEYDYTFIADIAYLKTDIRVDYNRCERIMDGYLDDMVKLSSMTDRQHYYVQSNIDTLSIDEILDNMMELGLVSYVVSGNEYSSVKGNYVHYLMGVNGSNYNYLSDEGDIQKYIGDNAVNLSKLIFILGSRFDN